MPAENDQNEAPSKVLVDEHSVILRVLDVLEVLVTRGEQSGQLPREPLGRCVEFFRLFADACHHAKEESLLFPVLEQRGIPRDGGPIGVMLFEHEQGRALVRQMAAALERCDSDPAAAQRDFQTAARDYLSLLRAHIGKENNVLFPMGEQMMTGDDRQSLCRKFCEVGCKRFEGKRKEQLQQLADQLEQEVRGGA